MTESSRSNTAIWIVQGLVSYLICLSFGVSLFGKGFNAAHLIYFAFASFCQVLQYHVLLGILLLFCQLHQWTRNYLWVFSTVAFTCLNIFLLLDRLIFAQMGFHINGVVWTVISTPGGIRSLALEWNDYIAVTLITLSPFLLSYGIVWLSRFIQTDNYRMSVKGRRLAIITISFALITSDKILFATADMMGMSRFNAVTRAIPFYQSTHVRRLAAKYFPEYVVLPSQRQGSNGENHDLGSRAFGGSNLRYPLVDPRKEPPLAKQYNVVWIVLDSLRADLIDETKMPNLAAFAREHTFFKEHYSGGNNTRMGMFSLFYGLDAYHWHDILREHLSPYLIERLMASSYEMQIISSTALTFPEFRQTIFVNLKDQIHDNLPGQDSWERDDALVVKYGEFLQGRSSNSAPYFALLFLDGTHTKYGFPTKSARFKPYVQTFGHLESSNPTMLPKIKNRFYNAANYADLNLAKIFSLLKTRQQMSNTIVVVTGDHGEEFWESGSWGHFTAFSKEQTKVPLIIAAPNLGATTIEYLTKHQDLPATTLSLLGDRVDSSLYSHGQSAFTTRELPYALSCAWYSCALMDQYGWYVFGTETANFALQECYDTTYKDVECNHEAWPNRNSAILSLLRSMGRFR